MYKAMLTEFKIVSGGGPWGQVFGTIEASGDIYRVLFLLYIAFFKIAMLKLLTGIFVQHAATAAKVDRERVIHQNISKLFKEIDRDGSGFITRSEFLTHARLMFESENS